MRNILFTLSLFFASMDQVGELGWKSRNARSMSESETQSENAEVYLSHRKRSMLSLKVQDVPVRGLLWERVVGDVRHTAVCATKNGS